MATRAELFASGELKSPLNVKEKVIKTLRDAAEEGGGGGELPEVDDADNGKVLTVIDGAWAAGSGGGGGGGLLVHINFPENPEEPATLDKNWNEINAVVQSGVTPVFMDDLGGMKICVEVVGDNDGYSVALVDFSSGEPKGFAFISDSATGVLTYTPEL